MPDYHQQAHEEKSYRRAIFLFVSLAVAGACSMYPVACFKNYSSKEKAKLDKKTTCPVFIAGLTLNHGSRTCLTLIVRGVIPSRAEGPITTTTAGTTRDITAKTTNQVQLRAADTVRSGVGTPTIGTWIENAITDTAGIRLHAEPAHVPDNPPESPASDKSTFTYHVAQQEATAEQLRSLLSAQKNDG
ncbi:hypothetical protein D0865_13579 [Hortaea werneckii]|uniref:Uncharacterized protein n=1 Tax=Hortaea werneckii TaxID=91943 RepID=A0A3M7BAH4_HORWE|nr:hypothetical protein D0865_13579 [Hortaea werneckii]